ncbi:TetR/AcrR family transcriptional regulator [Gracilibacillus sp. HCP3S3_G5_1]|uniref:TetR/AcrR family transcriptional regulator n=1 Tax=unclassified Gracilibacillus TaxID=2625209 RepID=UPI003F8B9C22
MSTKKQIKEVAVRLYTEKGYEGATLKEIAKEVGIKPPSIYAFFANKEDLFIQVYQDTLNEHAKIVERGTKWRDSVPLKDQLYQMLTDIIDFQLREDQQGKILVRLMLFPPKIAKSIIHEQFQQLEEQEHKSLVKMFEIGIEKNEIQKRDPYELATSFQCIMDGLFWEMQRYDDNLMYRRLDVIWKQFWLGIAPTSCE